MTPTWQSPCGTATLYLGDCLDVLPTLAKGSVDAVVTDPPYSSGGAFRGDRAASAVSKYVQSTSIDTCRSDFTGDNRDQRSFLVWCTLWCAAARAAAVSGASFASFIDWRQLPTMTDAVQAGGWVWRNLATWWKRGVRMQRGKFSLSAEYLVLASNGGQIDGECSPQNVLDVRPVDGAEKEHLAEKPVELVDVVVSATPRGCAVLDPFMGSGTAGVACVRTGRRFVGIEIDERYFEIARRRIERALAEHDEMFPVMRPDRRPDPVLFVDGEAVQP